ncbi:MAG: exported protein of unknown function [Candidatus Saccharibacteria bacterium]|nr:exported protein of unknown function [Candidatus Saccharibacteria bacterium]
MLVLATVVATFQTGQASAAQITTRSLTLVAGASDGGSKIGGVVNHLFTFTPGTSGQTIGSIQFLYCTTASVAACVLPTGLVTTSATIFSQSAGANGFTLVNTTNGAPYLTRTAAAITGAPALSYQLNTITNPTTAGGVTFFVRITIFTAAALGGTATDTGSVAASTAAQIVLTGTMPESLIFCAGATISTTASIPDCTTATSGAVSFNQLFSPTDTATATSQMAASTNAASGYVITVNGTTLTSGANTIPTMATLSTGDLGVRGTGQFGMNLKLNTTLTSTVAVGAEVAAAANGTSLRGQATTGYNSVDHFRYVSGETVANSANGTAGPTNSQIFTASYIVNVAGNQASGTYTTTLTYICTATY